MYRVLLYCNLLLLASLVACGTFRDAVDPELKWVESMQQRLNGEVALASDTTLYLIAIDIQSGQTHGTVWTSLRAFDFVYDDTLSVDDDELTYSPFVVEHLAQWDTTAVRTRELEQGPMLDGSRVYATLVVNTSLGSKSRQFVFEEFFDSLRAPHEQ